MESMILGIVVPNCAYWNHRNFIVDCQVPILIPTLNQSRSALTCFIDWVCI